MVPQLCLPRTDGERNQGMAHTLVGLLSIFLLLIYLLSSQQVTVDKKLAVEKELAVCNEKIVEIAKQISFVENMSKSFTSTSSSQLDYQISALMQVLFTVFYNFRGFNLLKLPVYIPDSFV